MCIRDRDDEAILYQNNNSTSNNFLNVKSIGNQGNIDGYGAKVKIFAGEKNFYNEIKTTRGFQSSVPPIAHFGLGGISKVDRIEMEWLSGKKTILENVEVNQTIEIKESEAKAIASTASNKNALLKEVTDEIMSSPFVHKENPFDDLQNQILLPHKQSQNGPFVSCLLYTSPSPRDATLSRMPSSA